MREIWIVPVFKVYCDVCIVKNWRHPSLEIGIVHIIGGLPYGSLFFSKYRETNHISIIFE